MALGRFIEEDIDLHNFRKCERLLRDSKIDEILSQAITARNRGRTGRPSQNPYTVRAVVMAQLLAVASPGPTTMRRMVDILWHLSPGQLDVIGMTGRITSDRRHQMAVSPAVHRQEYERFRDRHEQVLAVMDSSPDPRMRRETNQGREERHARLSNTQRADARAREQLLHLVMNALVRASTVGYRPKHYRGHVRLDETWFKSLARTSGTGTRPEKLGGADPDAAWRNDKKTDLPRYVHMFVFAMPAAMPYERGVPSIVTGIRLRMAHNESDTDGAVAAVKAHIANGWGSSHKRPCICYADRGYTDKRDFAVRMLDLGYMVCADAKQPGPAEDFVRPEGPILIAGRLLCPAARHLLKFRNLPPLDEQKASADDLRARQDLIDAMRMYEMPTNGRPLPLSSTGPNRGSFTLRVACPAMSHLGRCRWMLESMEQGPEVPLFLDPPPEPEGCCMKSNSTVRLPGEFLKHLDVDLRGSFKHADAFNFNRAGNEAINSFWQRPDMGGVQGDAVQMMGRANIGLVVAMAVALTNVSILERIDLTGGGVNKIPKTPRVAQARRRAALIEKSRQAHA